MKNTEEILKDLEEYTEKEIIYRNYWKVRNEPKKRIEYMKEIEEYVRQQHLLIFDFPFITYPEILSERDFYSRLSISKHSNVNVVRHLRYTPIFEHSHTFFKETAKIAGLQIGNICNFLNTDMLFIVLTDVV